MKYLAILKDSFREAIDSKVIYFTLGLAALVIVLIGSVSFTPLAAEPSFRKIVGQFTLVNPDHGKSFQLRPFNARYTVEDVRPLNDAASPEQGDYRFRLKVEAPDQFERAVAYWSAPPQQSDTDLLEKLKDKGDKKDLAKQFLEIAKQWAFFAPRLTVTKEQADDFIKGMFAYHGNVTVSEVTPLPRDKGALVYEVTTRGTTGVLGWPHQPALFFGLLPLPFAQASLSNSLYFITNQLIGSIGAWVTIILSVVITAFFIPNMLHKGTIDLLLAKPIHRPGLLVYKYLGGLAFILLNTGFVVLGVFAVLGLRSGVWVTGFLWMVPILTFFFAILYAMSTLMAVVTRSAVVAILVTVAFWFLCFLAGVFFLVFNLPGERQLPGWAYATVDAVHNSLPRTSDLGNLSDRLVFDQVLTEAEIRRNHFDILPQTNVVESVGVSLGWIAFLLGLACWRFAVKDY